MLATVDLVGASINVAICCVKGFLLGWNVV